MQRAVLESFQAMYQKQKATLLIENGRIQILPATTSQHTIQGGHALVRLLIGADEPDEIIQQAKMDCTGMAAKLAQVLFPNMRPILSHWDEF